MLHMENNFVHYHLLPHKLSLGLLTCCKH